MPDLKAPFSPPIVQSKWQGDRNERHDRGSSRKATAGAWGLKEQVACGELRVRHSLGSHGPRSRGLALRRPRPILGPWGLGLSRRLRPVQSLAGFEGPAGPHCCSFKSRGGRKGEELLPVSSLYFRSLRIYPIWLTCIKKRRLRFVRAGEARNLGGQWGAFCPRPSRLRTLAGFFISNSRMGRDVNSRGRAGSSAYPRGVVAWGGQQEVDE